MKKMNKKGFTLAELLIVIAIIAVLIAIAIPTFSGALDNARRQTDHANIRSAYSVLQVATLTGQIDGKNVANADVYVMQKDGSFVKNGSNPYTLKADGDSSCVDCAGCPGTDSNAGASKDKTKGKHTKGFKIQIVVTQTGAAAPTFELQLVTA